MAAYIPVPRDLTRVKTKVFLNLTKRQLICFGLAALIGVPSHKEAAHLLRTGGTHRCAVILFDQKHRFYELGRYEHDHHHDPHVPAGDVRA